eukprot:scaffold10862_cov33-Prasinocladus_malaysianus.AAC.2
MNFCRVRLYLGEWVDSSLPARKKRRKTEDHNGSREDVAALLASISSREDIHNGELGQIQEQIIECLEEYSEPGKAQSQLSEANETAGMGESEVIGCVTMQQVLQQPVDLCDVFGQPEDLCL